MLLGNKRVDDRGHRIATEEFEAYFCIASFSLRHRSDKGLTHETSAWFW